MQINIINKINLEKIKVKVFPMFFNEENGNVFFNKNLGNKKILEKIDLFNFKAKPEKIVYFEIDGLKYLIFGLKEKFTIEDIRRGYYKSFEYLKNNEELEILFELPSQNESVIKGVVESLDLGDYEYNKYISNKKNENLLKMNIYLNIDLKFENFIKQILVETKYVKFTRNLVNENSDIVTPIMFEKILKEFSKKYKLKIEILNEKKIKLEKLNLLYAVGKGSDKPPRLIIVEYIGDKHSNEKIALVGKGITFDTGGINLKPSGFLEDMKTDMGGAAAVISTFMACCELNLKKNIILVVSAAENGISSKSYKPGDILISHKGITVEIGNTDAEGRLVLADGLSYVQKKYSPTKIIDVATLTGACLYALGPSLIGMCGNDEELQEQIFKSGEKTFERVWKMPLYDEHREMIKSKFADIRNIGSSKFGGMITASAFLEKFIDDKVKWAHLDIAGAARSHKKEYYISEYGTGKGVRLLIDYLKNN